MRWGLERSGGREQPSLEMRRPEPYEGVVLLVVAGVLVLGGPGLLGGSLYLRWRLRQMAGRQGWLRVLAASGISLLWSVGLLHAWRVVVGHYGWFVPRTLLGVMWLAALPLIPLGTVVLAMWEKLVGLLRPKTLAERVAEEEQRLAAQEEARSGRAQQVVQHLPAGHDQALRLGVAIKSDVFPSTLDIRQVAGWLTFTERVLDQHLFLLGATGAGKSETLKQLISEVFQRTRRDVFVVDGKGDEELAAAIRGLAWHHGRGQVPVFRLGLAQDGTLYDGFRGGAREICNRLLVAVGVPTAEGDSEFYADFNRDLLQLVCYAPGGPPRSFEEVLDRVEIPWLLHQWRQHPREVKVVLALTEEKLDGLRQRLRPLVREFGPLIDPAGFALDETSCAVFSLRTQSVSDTASRFLQFLVEDFKDFAGKRQQRPGVLIIDEFGAFENRNIVALLALARSAKLGVVLATQDVASLGDEATRRLILANTRTKLLMASDFPEEIATLAGTIYRVESSFQHEQGQATGLGTARVQDSFKVNMNEAARLQPGEGFLIRQRYVAKVRVSPVRNVPPPPPEVVIPKPDHSGEDQPVLGGERQEGGKTEQAEEVYEVPGIEFGLQPGRGPQGEVSVYESGTQKGGRNKKRGKVGA